MPRTIQKQLATAQDIAHGVGKVTQQRGQTTPELDKVDIPLGLATDAEVSGIDNTKYPRVRVGSKEYQANSTGHQAAWDVKPLIYGAGVELTAANPFVYYDSVIYQALSVPVTLSGDPAGDDLNPVNPAAWSIFLSGGTGSSGGVLTWLYNSGSAVGGETEIVIPFSFSYIAAVYINGVYQSESLAYEATSNSVVLAEAIDEFDEVTIQVGTTPAQAVDLDPTLRADLAAGTVALDGVTKTYTLSGAVNSEVLVEGDLITVSDRGNGKFHVVPTSSITVNGWDYIQLTSTPSLSLSLEKTGEFNVVHFGADNTGATNTTGAFFAANAAIALNGGGKYEVPFGDYVVGEEVIDPSPGTRYYTSTGAIISMDGLDGVNLVMTGSRITLETGLHYGAFDPVTGAVHNAAGGGFFDTLYQATPLSIVQINNCKNVTLVNPTIDGNVNGLVLGGYWGDVDYQLAGDGIRVTNCENVTMINPVSNYSGRDGFYINGAADQNINVTMINPIAKYNGRQGLSWTGGSNLTIINPVFQYTGTAAVFSAPGAGLDIEDNGAGCKNLKVIGGVIAGNAGYDLLGLQSPTNIKFDGTVFAGSGRTIWIEPIGGGKDFVFSNCKIYGSVKIPGENSKYIGCDFYDVQYESFPTPDGRMFESGLATKNTMVIDCTATQTVIGREFRISDRVVSVKDFTYNCNMSSVPNAHLIGAFEPYSIDRMVVNDNLTADIGNLAIAGQHAYFDTSSINENNVNNWEFRGDKISTSPSGETTFVYSKKLSAPVSNKRTYTGNSNSILIPIGTGPKIVNLYKVAGPDALRFCSASIMVSSYRISPTPSTHGVALLAKSTFGLGTGDITVVLADASIGNHSGIKIESIGGTSLVGEVWAIEETYLTNRLLSVESEDVPEGAYTLPASGYPI